MASPASRARVEAMMTDMHQALHQLFRPVLALATAHEPSGRALRTMLVAILVNKAVDLIEGAPVDDGKGGRPTLQRLAQDILDGKLRGRR